MDTSLNEVRSWYSSGPEPLQFPKTDITPPVVHSAHFCCAKAVLDLDHQHYGAAWGLDTVRSWLQQAAHYRE